MSEFPEIDLTDGVMAGLSDALSEAGVASAAWESAYTAIEHGIATLLLQHLPQVVWDVLGEGDSK